MKQRTQIARVLANKPEILIMDEPFGALDAQTRKVMQEELIEIWRKTHNTIIFVTHDIREAILLGTNINIFSTSPKAHILFKKEIAMDYPRNQNGEMFNQIYSQIDEYFASGILAK